MVVPGPAKQMRARGESDASIIRRKIPLVSVALLTILVVGFGVIRLALAERHGFHADELQHLHSAWCISKSLIPYQDYFEHHTPWLHFILASEFDRFRIETDLGDVSRLMFFARRLIWLSMTAVVAMTYTLGALWRGRLLGLAAAVFVSGIARKFFQHSLEIRPDVPASALLLASTACFLLAVRREGARPGPNFWFLSSGVLLGAGVMFTQKLLMALPGFVLVGLVYELSRSQAGTPTRRFGNLLALAAGFVLPGLITLAYFAWHGAAWPFIEHNFLTNARWAYRTSTLRLFRDLTFANPVLVMLSCAGWVMALWRSRNERNRRRGDFVIVGVTGALVVGAFVLPVAWSHYALAFLPCLAVLAAAALIDGFTFLESRWVDRAWDPWASVSIAIVVTGTLALILILPDQETATMWLRGSLWLLAFLAVAAFSYVRMREAAVAVFLIAVSAYPLYETRAYFVDRTWVALRRIEYILQNTAPTETVLDGFTGWGVFRPHTGFYWFLHREVRAMLGPSDWEELARRLVRRELVPKWIIFDKDLQQVPAAVSDFLAKNYQPVGHGSLRVLLPTEGWTDEGIRDLTRRGGASNEALVPYVLVERGFWLPEQEGKSVFRRSRGRRSLLRVPIDRRDDFVVSFRARLDLLGHPVRMALSVNGENVGDVLLEADWRIYRFYVPKQTLHRGLNEFLLTYSQTPYLLDPEHAGRNSVVAFSYLELSRTK